MDRHILVKKKLKTKNNTDEKLGLSIDHLYLF